MDSTSRATLGGMGPTEQNIADNIYVRRRMLWISANGLGLLCKVTRQTVKRWELGVNSPTYRSLPLIASALQCRVADLIGPPPMERSASPVARRQHRPKAS